MIETGDEKRLPTTIGGLVDLAFAAYFERAPLYLGLALAAFALQAVVEFALPAWKIDTREGAIKYWTLQYLNILLDSVVITAVALGVATRVAGKTAASRAIVAALAARWPAAFLAGLVAWVVVDFLGPISGFGQPLDPPVLIVITAPVCWIFFGAISLAQPIAALSPERPALAALHGVGRALTLSFHRPNLPRLVIVAFASILPSLVAGILGDPRFHVPRLFWVAIPVDALTVGPLAALQTVFALDFARRAGVLSAPRD
ncbi:MAG: hypothetical protein JWO85_1816 [Candidatus Eremiobacteraeota bacterium]|nr:hypothetical protein [Candidatus Eremiobacteraeota bacterium]